MRWVKVCMYASHTYFLVAVQYVDEIGFHGNYICINTGKKFKGAGGGLFLWKELHTLETL